MAGESPGQCVDGGLLEQLLDFLGKYTPQQDDYQKRLHLLRALREYATGAPPYSLSYKQFQKYVNDHDSEDWLPRWKKPGTVEKEWSLLAARLLQPACYFLEQKTARMLASLPPSREEGRPDAVPRLRGYARDVAPAGKTREEMIELRFAPYRKPFLKKVAPLEHRLHDPETWLAEFLASYEPSTKATGTTSTGMSPGGRSIPRRQPSELTPEQQPTYVPMVSAREMSVTSIDRQLRELTLLVCTLAPPSSNRPGDLEVTLDPYREELTAICARFDGEFYEASSRRLVVCFGMSAGPEAHSLAAAKAAVRLLLAFHRLRRRVGPGLRPRFSLLLHSAEVQVNRQEGGFRYLKLKSEDQHSLDYMEAHPAANKIAATSTVFAAIEHAFHCCPLSTWDSRSSRNPVKVYWVRRERRETAYGGATIVARSPLIGRTQEMEVLMRAWQLAKQGKPSAVWLCGMVGIGKSHLMHELRCRVQKQDPQASVLVCRCDDWGRTIPLHPLTQMLKTGLGLRWLTSDQRRVKLQQYLNTLLLEDHRRAMGVLERLIADPVMVVARNVDHKRSQDAVLDRMDVVLEQESLLVLEQFLLAAVSGGPTLFILEDLHWADETSRRLVDSTLERLRLRAANRNLLVVITSRGRRLLQDKTSSGFDIPLRLDPLDGQSSRDMVRQLAVQSSCRLTEDQISSIVVRAGGHPSLLVEQVVGVTQPASWLRKVLGEIESQPALAIGNYRLHCKYVAQMGAILGMRFQEQDLRLAVFGRMEVRPAEQEMLSAHLDYLIHAEIIDVQSHAAGPGYMFRFEQVHDAIYESVSASQRQEHHMRIAEALESGPDTDTEECIRRIAGHYEKAEAWTRAAACWHRAFKLGLDRSDGVKATTALEQARLLLSRAPDEGDKNKLSLELWLDMVRLQSVLTGSGSTKTQLAFQQVEHSFRAVDDVMLAFRARWSLWWQAYTSGNLGSARQLCMGLLRSSRTVLYPLCRLEAHHAAWDTLFHLGDLSEALTHHLQFLSLVGRATDEDQRQGFSGTASVVCCLSRGALLLWLLGHQSQAANLGAQAIATARRLGHPNSEAQAYCHLALLHILRRDYRRAERIAQRAWAIASKHSFAQRFAMGLVLQVLAKGLYNPKAVPLDMILSALRQWEQTGLKLFTPLWYGLLAEFHLIDGSSKEGLKAVDMALEAVSQTQERFYESELHRVRAQLLTYGRSQIPAKARTALEESIEIARQRNAKFFELRSVLALYRFAGARDRRTKHHARQMLRDLVPHFAADRATPEIRDARSLVDH